VTSEGVKNVDKLMDAVRKDIEDGTWIADATRTAQKNKRSKKTHQNIPNNPTSASSTEDEEHEEHEEEDKEYKNFSTAKKFSADEEPEDDDEDIIMKEEPLHNHVQQIL
jgi:hypothetical protein